jgi:hypothetical protein
MPLPDLIRLLRAVGFEPEAEDIADLLWLAEFLPPSPPPQRAAPVVKPPKPAKPATDSGQAKAEQPPLPGSESQEPAAAPKTARTERQAEAVLYASAPGESSGLAYRVGGVVALRQRRALRRVLRPLLRRVPSRVHFRLDEQATAQHIADRGQWQPVMAPLPTRWLELDIVVDEWPSMILWRQPVHELIALFSGLGAFRSVQVWSFWTSPDGSAVALHNGLGAAAAAARPRPLRELVSVRGNRLVLILSDCVSPAWGNGVMGRTLLDWASSEMVAVVNPLPYLYWRRTGLGQAEPVYLRSPAPGTPNRKLEAIHAPGALSVAVTAGLHLPVLTLDPDVVSAWAKAIAGNSSQWVLGMRLPVAAPTRKTKATSPVTAAVGAGAAAAPPVPAPTPDPAALVERFRKTATPEAWKLAGYLSFIAPLSLPVMRLVHAVMLPVPQPEHLAEVYLSGLLRRARQPSGELLPGIYEFQPGAAELLQSSLLRSETAEMLRRVRDYLLSGSGAENAFQAVLLDPSAAPALPAGALPFASLPPEALRRLGGEYAAMADELTGRRVEEEVILPTQPQAAAIEWRMLRVQIAYQPPEAMVTIFSPLENQEFTRSSHRFEAARLLTTAALERDRPQASLEPLEFQLFKALFDQDDFSFLKQFLPDTEGVFLEINLSLPASLQPLPWEQAAPPRIDGSPNTDRSLLLDTRRILITRQTSLTAEGQVIPVRPGTRPAALRSLAWGSGVRGSMADDLLDWQELETFESGLIRPGSDLEQRLQIALQERTWPVAFLEVASGFNPGRSTRQAMTKQATSPGDEQLTPGQVEKLIPFARAIGLLVLAGPPGSGLNALAARLLNPPDRRPRMLAILVLETPLEDAFCLTRLAYFFETVAKTGVADSALLLAYVRAADECPSDLRYPVLHLDMHGGLVFSLPELAEEEAAAPPLAFTWYVVTDRLPAQSPLNVRAGPGTQYSVVGSASSGERLELLDAIHDLPERLALSRRESPAWLHVRTSRDIEGYVHSSYADTLFAASDAFDGWLVLPDSQGYLLGDEPAHNPRWQRRVVSDPQTGIRFSLPREPGPAGSGPAGEHGWTYQLSPAAPDGDYQVEVFLPARAEFTERSRDEGSQLVFGLPVGDIQLQQAVQLPEKAGWVVVGRGQFSHEEDNRSVTRLALNPQETITHVPLRFVPHPPEPVEEAEPEESQELLERLEDEIESLSGALEDESERRAYQAGPGALLEDLKQSRVKFGGSSDAIRHLTPEVFASAGMTLAADARRKLSDPDYARYLVKISLALLAGEKGMIRQLEVEIEFSLNDGAPVVIEALTPTAELLSMGAAWKNEPIRLGPGLEFEIEMEILGDVSSSAGGTFGESAWEGDAPSQAAQLPEFSYTLGRATIATSGVGDSACTWRFERLDLGETATIELGLLIKVPAQAHQLLVSGFAQAAVAGSWLTTSLRDVWDVLSQRLRSQVEGGLVLRDKLTWVIDLPAAGSRPAASPAQVRLALRESLQRCRVFLDVLDILDEIHSRAYQPLHQMLTDDSEDYPLSWFFDAEKTLGNGVDRLEGLLDEGVLDAQDLNWLRDLADIHVNLKVALKSRTSEIEFRRIGEVAERLRKLLWERKAQMVKNLGVEIQKLQSLAEPIEAAESFEEAFETFEEEPRRDEESLPGMGREELERLAETVARLEQIGDLVDEFERLEEDLRHKIEADFLLERLAQLQNNYPAMWDDPRLVLELNGLQEVLRGSAGNAFAVKEALRKVSVGLQAHKARQIMTARRILEDLEFRLADDKDSMAM